MMVLFVAAHESAVGPSRHFVAMQHFDRTWSEADINWQAKWSGSLFPLTTQ
jgi:hypothetical protein